MLDPNGCCSKILWFKKDCGQASCETSKNYITPKSVDPVGTYNRGQGYVFVVKPDQKDSFMQNLESNAVVVVDYRKNSDDEKYDQNIRIMNSHKIKSKEIQREIIAIIVGYNEQNPVAPEWIRTPESMLTEWKAHNDGFALAPLAMMFLSRDIKDNCAHVDFNNLDEPLGYWDYYKK